MDHTQFRHYLRTILRTHRQDDPVLGYPANMSINTARPPGLDTAPSEIIGFTMAQLQAKTMTDSNFGKNLSYLPDSSLLKFEDVPLDSMSPDRIQKKLKVGKYKGRKYKSEGAVWACVSSYPPRLGAINIVTYEGRPQDYITTDEIAKIKFYQPFSWIPKQDKTDGQDKIRILTLLAFLEQGHLNKIGSGKQDSERVSKALKTVARVREIGKHSPKRSLSSPWISSPLGLPYAATDSELSEDRKIPIPTHASLQAPENDSVRASERILAQHPYLASDELDPKMVFYKTEVPDAGYFDTIPLQPIMRGRDRTHPMPQTARERRYVSLAVRNIGVSNLPARLWTPLDAYPRNVQGPA